ncbi:Uncharacterised protein [Mycobacteroides abscessus subsp. abscessus]|nr:Uncharacterised protein [Mycobacteroides abscessus subsp. abscessus]SKW54996.1 Uncharacterised protein [Mycobacteroides abscessus subsp. abscessus]
MVLDTGTRTSSKVIRPVSEACMPSLSSLRTSYPGVLVGTMI